MKKSKSVTELRRQELVALKKKLGIRKNSILKAEQVVDAARDKKGFPNLHTRFEWSDSKAARLHRIRQARELLVEVTVITHDSKEVQAFCSLKSDRIKPGGGYRETVSVLSHKQQRQELLEQAWAEFEYWRTKYNFFKELVPLFETADRINPRKTKGVRA